MEDFEQLAPAEGLSIRREPNKHIELTPNEKLMLTQWGSSDPYDIFLKLGESIVTIIETEHFQKWQDKEAFELSGLMAVGARIFFERLQREVNHQVEEFAGEIEFVKAERAKDKMPPEAMIQNGM